MFQSHEHEILLPAQLVELKTLSIVLGTHIKGNITQNTTSCDNCESKLFFTF